jgi:hypothetical protein
MDCVVVALLPRLRNPTASRVWITRRILGGIRYLVAFSVRGIFAL